MIRTTRMTVLLAGSALMLSGCAATSFAPPEVSLSRHMAEQSASENCAIAAGGAPIERNVDDALDLVHNFLSAYRCAMRVAADGRRGFQIPSFLALIGSTTAVALGAGPDWAIAGGAANAAFTAGNDYFDPAEQTAILRDAVEALACIEAEAVGVEAFARAPRAQNAAPEAERQAAEQALRSAERRVRNAELSADRADRAATQAANSVSHAASMVQIATAAPTPSAAPNGALGAAQASFERSQAEAAVARAELGRAQQELVQAQLELEAAGARFARAVAASATLGEIEISSEAQYFNMVAAALVQVEATATQRLSRRGTFEPQAVANQIADLAEQEEKAEDRAEDPNPPDDPTLNALFRNNRDMADLVQRVRLQLEVLRPRLDQCVLRAQV